MENDSKYTIEELEKIRLDDYNNKYIDYHFLSKNRVDGCMWEIVNCRIHSIGHKFMCNAYNYNLKQAIELAQKNFYEK